MKIRLGAGLLFVAILLAGCAGRNPELLAALKTASVSEVVVEVPPGMGEALVADMNGVTDKDKAPAVAAAVKAALIQKCMGQPGGGQAARLRVTLTHMSVASSAGRVLGSTSVMRGTARLENIQTGALIAHLGEVQGDDKAMQGQGVGGALVALAVNAASAASEDRIGVLSDHFAESVKRQLIP